MSVVIRALNNITFKRLNSPYCESYFIYRCIDGLEDLYIGEVKHPITPCRHKMEKILEYNERQQWYIDDNIVSDNPSDVFVYVNGQLLKYAEYTFNSTTNSLIVHQPLGEKDFVNIGYYVDKIQYIDNYTGHCTYKIVPMFKEGYVTGKHSRLDGR